MKQRILVAIAAVLIVYGIHAVSQLVFGCNVTFSYRGGEYPCFFNSKE